MQRSFVGSTPVPAGASAPTQPRHDVGPSDELMTVRTSSRRAAQEAQRASLDPRKDGWTTELFADRAKSILSELLGRAAEGADSDIEQHVAPDFRGTQLRPDQLVEVFHDPAMSVRQQRGPAIDLVHEGVQGLDAALRELGAPLRDRSDVHTHVKIVRVSLAGDRVNTTALIELSGSTPTGALEQHAKWNCDWQRESNDALRLRSIQSDSFQETTALHSEGVWFADCTASVLDSNPAFRQQLVYGLNHWLQRIERSRGLHVFARTGLAVGDVNGDGLDDLYLCQAGGLPNRLFVQQPDGTAKDVSHESGVDWLDHTSSALLVDLDNDHDQDLILAMGAGLVVMANNGRGQFEVQTNLKTAGSDLQSLSAVDYDSDGDLDLYICIDFARRATAGEESSFVYHDANDGGSNALFRNDIAGGDWRFADVTESVGLDVHNRRHSLAASWEDYDNDGDQDLYVANDYGQNCLYRNDAGRFVEVATDAQVVDFGSGMSVSWGDYDRDGWMDLYVGNMFSSAGNRITHQQQFKRDENEQTRATYGRFAKGNSLFRSDGGEQFVEKGSEAGVEMARWAWSSLFADVNNDGWQDLVVANGYITTEDTGDL